MKRPFRTVLTVVAASLVFSSLASGSASALQFSKTKDQFTIEDGIAYLSTNSERNIITCDGSSGAGEVTGSTTATATLTLQGCHDTTQFGRINCTSEGARETGEVKTKALPVLLAKLSLSNPQEVGLVFNYKNGNIVKWSCGGTPGGMQGAFIARVTPVNTLTSAFSVSLESAENGEQNPTFYFNAEEKKVTAVLQMSVIAEHWEDGSIRDSLPVKTAEPLEIKA
jgi:hypothetical protein